MTTSTMRHAWRTLLLTALLVLLASVFNARATAILAAPAHPAATYSCPQGSHCYGISDWYNVNNEGGFNEQTIPNLSCTGSGCTNGTNDFIDNEMWIEDYSSWAINQCDYPPPLNQTSGCWVEAGVWTYYNGHGEVNAFFWADMRPCGGKFNVHVGPEVSSSLVGQITQYTIQATSIAQPDTCNFTSLNTFNVNIFSRPNGGVTQMSGNSTYVPISPGWINVGSEVQGSTGGQHEDSAHQTHVEYFPQGGNWTAVNTGARVDDSYPPTGNPFVTYWDPNGGSGTGDTSPNCC
jgi:hypothetical protein